MTESDTTDAHILRPKPLILASASPRRSELLMQAGYTFRVQPSPIEEEIEAHPPHPEEYAPNLARHKAEDIARNVGTALVVGADTIVVCAGEILNKPADDEDALRMLTMLQGRTHQVITGLAVLDVEDNAIVRRALTHVCTDVTMRPASRAELSAYVATGEPHDKAGAYAIQGRAAVFIEGIVGDYANVVGLPLYTLARILEGFGLPPFPSSER